MKRMKYTSVTPGLAKVHASCERGLRKQNWNFLRDMFKMACITCLHHRAESEEANNDGDKHKRRDHERNERYFRKLRHSIMQREWYRKKQRRESDDQLPSAQYAIWLQSSIIHNHFCNGVS